MEIKIKAVVEEKKSKAASVGGLEAENVSEEQSLPDLLTLDFKRTKRRRVHSRTGLDLWSSHRKRFLDFTSVGDDKTV